MYGTTAELIKIWPVVSRLDRAEYVLISTGQQPHDLVQLENAFSLHPDYSFRNSMDPPLTRVHQVVVWTIRTTIKLFRLLTKLELKRTDSMVIVHGDTITSTLAAYIGFAVGYRVAHIEAGLRSGNMLNPFPEEIDRILTSFVTSVHFAPGAAASKNLVSRSRRGEVIDTYRNTVVDSLTTVPRIKPRGVKLPDSYALVCLHRAELLSNKAVLSQTLRTLSRISLRLPLVLVVDPLTESYLRLQESYLLLKQSRFVTVVGKLIYPEFQYLLQTCQFLITDSGGQQEESAQLGIPCIVHRRATERLEGIGSNVVLSHWSQEALISFSTSYHEFVRAREPSESSPSDIIVTRLRKIRHD